MAIKFEDIEQEVIVYDEMVEFDVEVNGKEEVVKFYPYFKVEKINELIKEMSEFYANAKTEKIFIKDEEFPDMVMFFIIRHFTDLDFGESVKADILYKQFNVVKNAKLFKLLSESFPRESVISVFDNTQELMSQNEVLLKTQEKLMSMNKEMRSKYSKVGEWYEW